MSISAPGPYVPLAVAGAVTLTTDVADSRISWTPARLSSASPPDQPTMACRRPPKSNTATSSGSEGAAKAAAPPAAGQAHTSFPSSRA